MTLQDVIKEVCREWWGVHTPGLAVVKSGTDGLSQSLELAVRAWMGKKDHLLDQIIALSLAGNHPCLRRSSKSIIEGTVFTNSEWNLQLSPEAGHLIDFDGTLEDILEEACEKYLPKKEATT